MAALMGGLLKNDLKKLLTKTYLRNFLHMLAHTNKYARTEEAFVEEISVSFGVAGQYKEHSPK